MWDFECFRRTATRLGLNFGSGPPKGVPFFEMPPFLYHQTVLVQWINNKQKLSPDEKSGGFHLELKVSCILFYFAGFLSWKQTWTVQKQGLVLHLYFGGFAWRVRVHVTLGFSALKCAFPKRVFCCKHLPKTRCWGSVWPNLMPEHTNTTQNRMHEWMSLNAWMSDVGWLLFPYNCANGSRNKLGLFLLHFPE